MTFVTNENQNKSNVVNRSYVEVLDKLMNKNPIPKKKYTLNDAYYFN
jgi:hypothetical protein